MHPEEQGSIFDPFSIGITIDPSFWQTTFFASQQPTVSTRGGFQTTHRVCRNRVERRETDGGRAGARGVVVDK